MVTILKFVFTIHFIAGLLVGAIGGFIAEFFVARNNKKLLEQAQKALTKAQNKAQQVENIVTK
jgi:gas vesicle protein